jgi:hypothetical protein
MAYQCTSCGSQTRPGAKFCHTCGTPVATTSLPPTMPMGASPATGERKPISSSFESSAPPKAAATEATSPPTAYIPQTPQTYHTPPYPMHPPKKSGKTVKVVLITLAIFVVLSLAGIIGGVYIASKKASEKFAELKRTGLPTVTSDPNSVPDDKLGVPVYPGAKRTSTFSGGLGPLSGTVVEFVTDDDLDEVAEFYRAHFAGQEGQQLRVVSEDNREVVFQVSGPEGTRIITVSPNDNNAKQTKIVILSGRNQEQTDRPRGRIPPPPEVPPPPPPRR